MPEGEGISKKLIADFSFKIDGFSDPIEWTDGTGFSRIKKLDNGNASLFKLGIGGDQLHSASPKKGLWVSINYGRENMGGITLGSEEQNISGPVDLDYRNEFFYDIDSGKYFHKDKEISSENLFKIVLEAHTRPTKAIVGFWVRCRLWFWRKLLPALITWLDIALVNLLWLISGEKIKENILRRLLDTNRSERINERIPSINAEFEESRKMDFFGYKAKRWSVVFYCGLHLVLFTVIFFYKLHSTWVETIFASNFLALCYVVVSFAFTEAFVPRILKAIIGKITPAAFGSIAFKRLEI
jgi:hypothetical protein